MDITRRGFLGIGAATLASSAGCAKKIGIPEEERKIVVEFERGRHTPQPKEELLEIILRGKELRIFNEISSSKFPLLSTLNEKVELLSRVHDYWTDEFKPYLGASYVGLADIVPGIMKELGRSRGALAEGFKVNLNEGWSGWKIPKYAGGAGYMLSEGVSWKGILTFKNLSVKIDRETYFCDIQLKAKETYWPEGVLSPILIEVSKKTSDNRVLNIVVSPWEGGVAMGIKGERGLYVMHAVRVSDQYPAIGLDPTGNGALLEEELNRHMENEFRKKYLNR